MQVPRPRWIVAALLLALLAVVWVVRRQREHPPNILLITLDTTRADRIGAYGYAAARTPVLDALAARGVLFDQAFSPVPLTLPAHATLLTGLQPPEHGIRTNARNRLGPDVPVMAEILRQRGYQTGAFIAAWVLAAKFGLDRGFDRYDDQTPGVQDEQAYNPMAMAGTDPQAYPYRRGDAVVDAALTWLRATRTDTPFFCWVHLYDPHDPYHHHADLFTEPFEHPYDAEVAFMDRQIGRVLTFLQQAGRLRRTLVIAVGDHGEDLGDHGEPTHGYLIHDATQRVPMIIAGPGVSRRPRRIHAMVSIADLFPTVIEYGLTPDERRADTGLANHLERIRARSLKTALRGREPAPQPVYAETDQPYLVYGWSPLRSLRDEAWHYIHTPIPELYDRITDPRATTNLAVERDDILVQMEDRLHRIEADMTAGEAPVAHLSEREIRQLESLGYLGGGTDRPPIADSNLPDIKTMLPLMRMEARLRGRMMQKQFDQTTLDDARALVAASPESAMFRILLATVLIERDDIEAAETVLHDAARIEPDNLQINVALAWILFRRNEHDQALIRFREIIERDPEHGVAHNNVGAILLRRGRTDEAVSHLRQAVRYAPRFDTAHRNLARALQAVGDADGAVTHYRTALELRPGWAAAAVPLAWMLATHPDDAVREPAAALRLAWQLAEADGHQKPDLQALLAAAMAAAGRFQQAAETARNALESIDGTESEDPANEIWRPRLQLFLNAIKNQRAPVLLPHGAP